MALWRWRCKWLKFNVFILYKASLSLTLVLWEPISNIFSSLRRNPQLLYFSIYKCCVCVLPAFIPLPFLAYSTIMLTHFLMPFLHVPFSFPIYRFFLCICYLRALCLSPSFLFLLLSGYNGNHKEDMWLPGEKIRARWAGFGPQVQFLPSHERKQHVQL